MFIPCRVSCAFDILPFHPSPPLFLPGMLWSFLDEGVLGGGCQVVITIFLGLKLLLNFWPHKSSCNWASASVTSSLRICLHTWLPDKWSGKGGIGSGNWGVKGPGQSPLLLGAQMNPLRWQLSSHTCSSNNSLPPIISPNSSLFYTLSIPFQMLFLTLN